MINSEKAASQDYKKLLANRGAHAEKVTAL